MSNNLMSEEKDLHERKLLKEIVTSQNNTVSVLSLPPGYIMHNNGQSVSEKQVISRDRAGRFLTTLATGCRECLPNSATSTTMVANPINVFRAINQGFLPGALNQLTKGPSDSLGDQAQLCADGLIPDRKDLPVENQVLSTLTSITSNVIAAEILEAIAALIYWVNVMHFAASIMRYV